MNGSKLSYEKVTHLSHVIVRALEGASGARLTVDRNQVRLKVVDLLRQEMRRDEEIERRVRTKIVSQKRTIPDGQPGVGRDVQEILRGRRSAEGKKIEPFHTGLPDEEVHLIIQLQLIF